MQTLDLTSPELDPARVLDPETAPDSAWAQALRAGDVRGAMTAYVATLRAGPPRFDERFHIPAMYHQWFGWRLGYQHGFHCDPELTLKRRYIGVYGLEHQFAGDIDWWFDPSAHLGAAKTREWSAQFNRQYHWYPLAQTYRATGDARYARHWEYELRTWHDQCPRPPVIRNQIVPNPWRTIEMGIRMAWTWSAAFDAFRTSAAVSDEALWLLACLYREHGLGLLHTPTANNFKTMETNGLMYCGLLFPELNGAAVFAATALDRALAEIQRQFYPDGSQLELAPAYAVVAFSNLLSALKLAEHFQRQHGARRGWTIPRSAWQQLAQAVHVLGRSATPTGDFPPCHDSESLNIEPICAFFTEHVPAADLPTRPWRSAQDDLLPWAGYAILRHPGRYALLDAGPYGAGHQHADALQVLTWADGDWLTIDPGKPLYNRSEQTVLQRSAGGHNVVLCDSQPHLSDPLVLIAEEPTAACTGAGWAGHAQRQRTTGEPGVVFTHRRLLISLDELGWLVCDHLLPEDERAHAWEWLWHCHGQTLKVDGQGAGLHAGGRARLHISARGLPGLRWREVTGQLEPQPRGWRVNEQQQHTPLLTVQLLSPAAPGAVRLVTLLALQPQLELNWEMRSEAHHHLTVGDRRLQITGPWHAPQVQRGTD